MSIFQSQSPAVAFSADVRLTLNVGGEDYDLAEAGPAEVVLRNARAIAPGLGRIVISIDGQRQVHQVRITGQSEDRRSVFISDER